MRFQSASWRGRPTGGVARPGNNRRNKSPSVQACLPADLFDRLADEAARRSVPLSALIREALHLKYPKEETSR